MRHSLFALVALVLVAAPPSVAQVPAEPTVLDAFDRQRLRARYDVDAAGGVSIAVIGERAVYPDGTELVLTVKPIGASSRIASIPVTVHQRRFRARFTFVRYLPPGEYEISAFFMLTRQRRKVAKTYVAEYVPAAEREAPCDFCRYHYGMTAVAVADPRYWFADETLRWKRGVPLWERQKQDYHRVIRARYREWFADILDARSTLEDVERDVLGFGSLERRELDLAVSREPAALPDRPRAHPGWAAIARGLAQCGADLARRGQPADVLAYWRRRVRSSAPASVAQRLAAVDQAMVRYDEAAYVCVDRELYRELRAVRDAVESMVHVADARVAGAIECVRALEVLRDQPETGSEELWRSLDARYSELARATSPRASASSIEAIARGLGPCIEWPVPTWPAWRWEPPRPKGPPRLAGEPGCVLPEDARRWR